jgi:hypothetical protein
MSLKFYPFFAYTNDVSLCIPLIFSGLHRITGIVVRQEVIRFYNNCTWRIVKFTCALRTAPLPFFMHQ